MSELPPGAPPPPGTPPPGGMPPAGGTPPPAGGFPPPPSTPPPSYQPPAYQPQGGAGVAAPPQNGKAVAALVLGIIGVCGCLTGPIALFIGRQAMQEIDASGGTQGGRTLAQAGFILGIIGSIALVLWILYWVVIVLIVGSAATHGVYNTTP